VALIHDHPPHAGKLMYIGFSPIDLYVNQSMLSVRFMAAAWIMLTPADSCPEFPLQGLVSPEGSYWGTHPAGHTGIIYPAPYKYSLFQVRMVDGESILVRIHVAPSPFTWFVMTWLVMETGEIDFEAAVENN
jgi:hypothetical protein